MVKNSLDIFKFSKKNLPPHRQKILSICNYYAQPHDPPFAPQPHAFQAAAHPQLPHLLHPHDDPAPHDQLQLDAVVVDVVSVEISFARTLFVANTKYVAIHRVAIIAVINNVVDFIRIE
jgi:hypothetical protein